jgi:hypothetical protein
VPGAAGSRAARARVEGQGCRRKYPGSRDWPGATSRRVPHHCLEHLQQMAPVAVRFLHSFSNLNQLSFQFSIFRKGSLINIICNIERCSEIERANRILLERMTSILAGPATHNQKGLGYAKTAMARRPTFSSKKRGATALPSSSGARAFLMSGIQNPAAPGGVE